MTAEELRKALPELPEYQIKPTLGLIEIKGWAYILPTEIYLKVTSDRGWRNRKNRTDLEKKAIYLYCTWKKVGRKSYPDKEYWLVPKVSPEKPSPMELFLKDHPTDTVERSVS